MCLKGFWKEKNWNLDEDDYGVDLSNMAMWGDVMEQIMV